MTFADPEPQDDIEEEETPSSLRRQLGKQAAENKRLQEELAKRDRDLAFTTAGLPDTPMAKFFRDNYDGESSEEAIRARAAELGLIGNPSQSVQDSVGAIDDMSNTATGASMTMPADQAEAMDREMRALAPGPRYGEQLEQILQKYGRPTRIDET